MEIFADFLVHESPMFPAKAHELAKPSSSHHATAVQRERQRMKIHTKQWHIHAGAQDSAFWKNCFVNSQAHTRRSRMSCWGMIRPHEQPGWQRPRTRRTSVCSALFKSGRVDCARLACAQHGRPSPSAPPPVCKMFPTAAVIPSCRL